MTDSCLGWGCSTGSPSKFIVQGLASWGMDARNIAEAAPVSCSERLCTHTHAYGSCHWLCNSVCSGLSDAEYLVLFSYSRWCFQMYVCVCWAGACRPKAKLSNKSNAHGSMANAILWLQQGGSRLQKPWQGVGVVAKKSINSRFMAVLIQSWLLPHCLGVCLPLAHAGLQQLSLFACPVSPACWHLSCGCCLQ